MRATAGPTEMFVLNSLGPVLSEAVAVVAESIRVRFLSRQRRLLIPVLTVPALQLLLGAFLPAQAAEATLDSSDNTLLLISAAMVLLMTPAAGFVTIGSGMAIGAITAVLCYISVQVKVKFRFDDSLDTYAVHGVGGTAGALLRVSLPTLS